MAEYDVVIRGGTIVDGTRTPRYVSDLAIKDGRIAKIGGLHRSRGTKELDASGLIVAPGIIDLHTHYDAEVQWDPYCTGSGWHGITTVALGNCGFGFAPCPPNERDRDRLMLALTRNELMPFDSMKLGMLWDWETFPEWLNSLDRIPKGVNVLSLVGLTPVYAWGMGSYEEAKSRRPTEAELKRMCGLVDQCMDAGAIGWSAQVDGPDSPQRDFDGTPMITDLIPDEELLAFGEVLAARDEGVIQLTYWQDRASREKCRSFHERLAAVAKRPVMYNLISADADNPEYHRGTLRWLEECAKKRLPVYGQSSSIHFHPIWTYKDYTLWDDLPNWRPLTLGTIEERKAKMLDPKTRAVLRAEFDAGMGPRYIRVQRVTKVGRRDFEHYVGQTLTEIAQKEGKHPVDTLLDLVAEDNLEIQFEYIGMSRDNPKYPAEILESPYVVAGISDGSAHLKLNASGYYGTQVVSWLARDAGLLSLEQAHYKLSYLPAHLYGMRDRGFLREGAWADIVVYDLEKLGLGPREVAHDWPGGDWRWIRKSQGYRWTLVNGQVTFEEDNKVTGAVPGKLLRHGVS